MDACDDRKAYFILLRWSWRSCMVAWWTCTCVSRNTHVCSGLLVEELLQTLPPLFDERVVENAVVPSKRKLPEQSFAWQRRHNHLTKKTNNTETAGKCTFVNNTMGSWEQRSETLSEHCRCFPQSEPLQYSAFSSPCVSISLQRLTLLSRSSSALSHSKSLYRLRTEDSFSLKMGKLVWKHRAKLCKTCHAFETVLKFSYIHENRERFLVQLSLVGQWACKIYHL